MHNAASDQALDPRCKEARPEHITVADEIFERNDLTAKRYGGSERTINRGDKDGAPFRFFNGVKYRPVKRYDAFILDSIQVRQPPSKQTQKKARKRTADSRALAGRRSCAPARGRALRRRAQAVT